MHKCPWCGVRSFSFWQKHWLGPARSIECSHCHRRVSTPWWALVYVTPLAIFALGGFIYLGPYYGNLGGLTIGMVIGYLISLPLNRYIPLVRR